MACHADGRSMILVSQDATVVTEALSELGRAANSCANLLEVIKTVQSDSDLKR